MNASLHLALVALLCVGLAGCAAALQGGTYLAGLLLHEATSGRLSSSSPSQPSQLAQAERERCSEFTSRGIEVTEPQEIAIPTIEGQVRTFEATILRREFEGVGSARRESRMPKLTVGTLVITERSLLLVPPPDRAGLRIPYELVQTVELNPLNAYSIIVNSCTGQFEIFNVLQGQRDILEPQTAAAAAAQLKDRVAEFQATTHRQTKPPG